MQLASWFMYIQHSHCDYTIFCYQVNLLDAANKKSKQLSGGMRRRLSVAIACVGSPEILILG